MKMNKRPLLILIMSVALVLFISLACTQSGEILTPEEATQRVQATEDAVVVQIDQQAETAELSNGDTFEFVGKGFLVSLYAEPGARTAYSHASRGDEGVVISSENLDGVIWYQVDSGAGEGWVPEESVKVVEGGSEDSLVGQTAFLVGKGYLINLVEQAGSMTIVTNQQRGVEVEVLKRVSKDGKIWYLIDAPAGEGWVPEDNLSLEKPE
ncbi:MAG: hypothetical protein U5K99_08255 [Anaerolineales bacterium]|nr:hypothetical protein [Anaerolineales bacterium]